MTIELERLLPHSVYERLQAEAERQHADLTELVRDVLATYVEQLESGSDIEIEDTSDEVVLASFRQAWMDIQEDNTVPADEALAALRAKRANRQAGNG